MSRKRIMIVAGEASGDEHAGRLAEEVRRLRPDAELFGIGGGDMRKAGVDTLVDIASLAVVGIWEVLAHFKDIRGAFNRMKDILLNDPPDVVVLVDYPDFNLRLAKVAKKAGVPVVYYISPTVWAWRPGRVKTIKDRVRKMLVALSFEEPIYREAGVDCVFVGHPLLDTLYGIPPRETLAERFGLDPARPVLGLLPGSRKKEIYYHLPVMLESYRKAAESVPGLQAVIPAANTLTLKEFEPYMSGYEDVKLVEGDTPGVMALMDAAVVASGTATLQTALYGKPMVIVYRLSPVTYHIAKTLVRGRVRHIGLVNLVAGDEVVPELIQDAANPGDISALISRLFCDKAFYDGMAGRLSRVREMLGEPGASRRAALEVTGLLG